MTMIIIDLIGTQEGEDISHLSFLFLVRLPDGCNDALMDTNESGFLVIYLL